MVTDGNERHRLHADLGKWMEAFCWVIGHLCAKIEKSDLISEQSNRFISQISFQIVKKIDRRDEDFFFFCTSCLAIANVGQQQARDVWAR